MSNMTIPDIIISHHHHRRWCTFFKPVPLLAGKEKAKSLPVLAIFRYFVTNLCTFWCPFHRPQPLTNIRYEYDMFELQHIYERTPDY